MPTTVHDLKRWYDIGKGKGATHLIVATDTFDWEDYPVFVMPTESVRERVAYYNGPNMQKVMEVYNLSLLFEEQRVGRAWNL